MRFWIQLKNGDLQIRDRQPTNRPFVSEQSNEVPGDFQHYQHAFKTNTGIERKMDSYCGYDRGPKRESVIKQMFEEMKDERATSK